jgi:mono/diheme cytochrome c family protein
MSKHMLTVIGAIGLSTAGWSAEAPAPDAVARGRYLVAVLGCNDCHSPKRMAPEGPVPDPSRLLSGHPEGTALPAPPKPVGPWIAAATGDLTAWSGPWGISYATNLTPDENTGLGIWTEEMFMKALKTGRHMGTSRPILPPMPIAAYQQLTETDLKAVYAYLRTLPKIKNRVPEVSVPPTPAPPMPAAPAPKP